MPGKKMLLLVEDDQVDALTVKRAVRETGMDHDIVHLLDGEEALAYLRGQGNPMPNLILLDLNMPRMNGLDFLKEVKQDPSLKRIPVIVLTTSSDAEDVRQSFLLNVAGYMTKPVDYKIFLKRIQVLKAYWELNRVPRDEWEVSHAGYRSDHAGGG